MVIGWENQFVIGCCLLDTGHSRIHAFKHSRILPQGHQKTAGNKCNNPPNVGVSRINVNTIGNQAVTSFLNFQPPDKYCIDKHT